MSYDHLQGLLLLLKDKNRYYYLKKIRGNYKNLKLLEKELINTIKKELKQNNIKFKLISRIKPVISINRKEKYNKILNKPTIINDKIGQTIILRNNNDCYKTLDLLLKRFKLRKESDLKNPEDFFKEPKLIKNTDSIAKNHIFVKIIFKKLPIHIILMTKNDVLKISKARKKYVRYIKTKIKGDMND